MSVLSESAASSKTLEAPRFGGEAEAGGPDETAGSKVSGATLIEEEKMEIGGVKWTVYIYYGKSIGYLFSLGTIILYAVYQVRIQTNFAKEMLKTVYFRDSRWEATFGCPNGQRIRWPRSTTESGTSI